MAGNAERRINAMIKRGYMNIVYSLLVVTLAAGAAGDLLVAQVVHRSSISSQLYQPSMTPNSDAAKAASSLPSGNPTSVHLKKHGKISFNRGYYKMTDGGGYLWDLQSYGNVYHGTPYAYSGGMYCHINGSNLRAGGNTGWRNRAGDEIEIDLINRYGLKMSRRVKVYKDLPLARWLEIIENPGSSPVTINLQVYTNLRYSTRSITTNTGKKQFGAKDSAFRTVGSSSGSVPTLHVVTSKGAKLRPAVQIQGNSIRLSYNGLTIPAGKTAILCHFESQNRDASAHSKMMSRFPMDKVMKDLPTSVRCRILNMRASSLYGDVSLDRLSTSDRVLLKNDDPIVGEIRNKSFRVSTVAGQMDLKTENLVGMAAGPDGGLRFAFADGQVVAATAPGVTLEMAMGTDGVLNIPLDKIAQWSYRISSKRPDEPKPLGASLALASGDHLAIDTSGQYPKFTFRWACGTVDLNGKHLLEVVTTAPGSGKFKAVFRNGTHITGVLVPSVPDAAAPSAPEGFRFDIKLVDEIVVKSEQIIAVRLGKESSANPALSTAVVLSGGDKLFGELADEKFQVTTSYGKIDIDVSQIKNMTFKSKTAGQVSVRMWSGDVFKGMIDVKAIGFTVTPGDRWALPVGKITSITCPQAIPPKAMRQKVEKLVAQLGAENYKDREAAATALVGIGKGIIPLVRRHLSNKDPEIRQRVEDVLEQLGDKTPAPAPPANLRFRRMEIEELRLIKLELEREVQN
ncbi:MAG: HEAT repeat domain-containing protein [bacterium]|nr:HEAT repeat domain-containing protein [bacterium]